MEHQMRRLVPRQVTSWRGKYMIEGDPEQRWRDCRIVDVSSAGAGVELLDTTAEEAEGCQIILAVHLRASVKNTGPERGRSSEWGRNSLISARPNAPTWPPWPKSARIGNEDDG